MTENTTPQDRLAAALMYLDRDDAKKHAAKVLAADPTIVEIHTDRDAADMELGRRIRDANDPLLAEAIDRIVWKATLPEIDSVRAALTEGE